MKHVAAGRAALLACLAVAGAVLAAGAQTNTNRQSADAWLDSVEAWRTAVADHAMGRLDAPFQRVRAWSNPDMQRVLFDVKSLVKALVDQHATYVRSRVRPPMEYRRSFTFEQLQIVLGLTEDEAQRGDASRVLKRGALLHTDVAMLAPNSPPQSPRTPGLVPSPPAGTGDVMITDGREVGREDGSQWEFARSLLDMVLPSPADDSMVRQWYIASTAHMEDERRLGQAGRNLARGLEIFPADVSLLFYEGTLHEALAAPRAQNADLPPGFRPSFGNAEAEWRMAESCFRQSLQWREDFPEGHLHFGRVTGLLGHHDAAVAELTKAAASIADPQLKYYAALFLGHELEAVDRRDEARASFERAAALSPTAQSPLLSLSELAQRHSDAPAALQAMARVFALPADDQHRDDPWWVYDVSHVRDADTLIASMRASLGGLPR
jgi:hypothetical protein